MKIPHDFQKLNFYYEDETNLATLYARIYRVNQKFPKGTNIASDRFMNLIKKRNF